MCGKGIFTLRFSKIGPTFQSDVFLTSEDCSEDDEDVGRSGLGKCAVFCLLVKDIASSMPGTRQEQRRALQRLSALLSSPLSSCPLRCPPHAPLSSPLLSAQHSTHRFEIRDSDLNCDRLSTLSGNQ
jgi:hypothetical protein